MRSVADALACGATGAKMGKINAEWHKSNRMPAKATLDQRVTWHLEHRKHCGCRSDLPRSIQQELDRRAKAK